MAKNRDLSKFPNAITVLDNGNVGIGTTSPVYKLDINDATRALDLIAGGDTFSYNGTIRARTSTGSTTALIHSSGVSYFLGGNVGMGTSSPSYPLHITASSQNIIYANRTTTDGDIMTLAVGGTNAFIFNTSSGIRTLESPGAVDFRHWINGAERLRITSSGNVGLATNSPAFRLDVSDAGSVISGTATIGSNMKGIRIYNTTSAVNNNAVGVWFSTGPHQAGIASFRATADTTWETSLAFYTHIDTTSGLTDATEKMRISGQGYVTKPYQPSFYATSTAGSTSYSSNEVVVFNSTRHNIGSHYNTSNGRFTAPVAGRYLFSVNVYAYGGYTNALVLTINGSQYTVQDVSPYLYVGAEVGNITDGFTLIWDLAAGDYVELRCRVGNSAQIYRAHSHFSGQLLG